MRLLKQLEYEDVEEILSHVKNRLQKRALQRVFKKITSLKDNEVKEEVDEVETEIRQVIKEAGLDDKIWVLQICENLKISHIKLLKGVGRREFELFLENVENPAKKLALRQIFGKVTGITFKDEITVPEVDQEMVQNDQDERLSSDDWVERQHPREERPATEGAYAIPTEEQANASEVCRMANNGLLCRGIYYTSNLEELIKERDLVIDVRENLEFKSVDRERKIVHHDFTSQRKMKIFEDHVDKHIEPHSGSVGENIWGVSLDEALSQDWERKGHHGEENFVSTIHFQSIPAGCIDLMPHNIQLRPEVISTLQEIEKHMKLSNYEPGKNFKDFFNRYGTHITSGVISFGGMLKSLAYSENFLESDRSNMSAVVSEASERALYLCFSNDTPLETPLNAHEVLQKTPHVCAGDLQNITIIVKKVGGLHEARNSETWERKLLENNNLWSVIGRQSIPTPMWKILETEAAKFENFERFVKAMLHEWRNEALPDSFLAGEGNIDKVQSSHVMISSERPTLEEGNRETTHQRMSARIALGEQTAEISERKKMEEERIKETLKNAEISSLQSAQLRQRGRDETEASEKNTTADFRLTEKERQLEETLKKVEEERRKLEMLRISEEKRQMEEIRKASDREELRKREEQIKLKELRTQEEEVRQKKLKNKEEEVKRQDEQLQKEEEERKRQEELRKEEERKRQEELRKEEEERKRREELQKEEERKRQEQLRKEEDERKRQEELQKEEEERKRQEELQKEEEERKRQEELQKEEEERKRKETLKKLEEEKRRHEQLRKEEEERKRVKAKKNAERRRKVFIRQDIQSWLNRSRGDLNDQNVRSYIEELGKLKVKCVELKEMWLHDILYLRDVQKVFTWAIHHMRNTTKKKRKQLGHLLRELLHPYDRIDVRLFPNIREITEGIEISLGINVQTSFKDKKTTSLPGYLKKSIQGIDRQSKIAQSQHLREVQSKLESLMKDQPGVKERSYEYLVGLCVLQLFGFRIKTFMFEGSLSKADICNMEDTVKKCLTLCHSFEHTIQKQAYILKLALLDMQQRQVTIQYMINIMPRGICTDLATAFKKASAGTHTFDYEMFESSLDNLFVKQQKSGYLSLLLYSLKNQFPFRKERMKGTKTPSQYPSSTLGKSTELLLEVLNMKQYYPQKLTYEQVITLTPDVYSDEAKAPKSLSDLPWYFMKHIIRLDSDIREKCHVSNIEDDSSDEDSEDEKGGTITTVHPLDLIYIIFLCADDFLRQELADKMIKCQYAVPCLLPSPGDGDALFCHWGLRNVSRIFYNKETVVNKTMVDVEAPMVLCLGVGSETSWKSRILNKMLSPQQETFWHQGLKGGNYNQRASQGMVEVAWYLPGRDDNKFPYPVTFANVRQTESHSAVFQTLHDASSVTCLFMEDIGDDLNSRLEAKTSLDKIIIVILHKKEETGNIKRRSLDLQEKFGLRKHQIIRKTAEDANFNTVFEQLKKSIENIVETHPRTSSLSKLAEQANESDCLEVDDLRCYYGQMAANSILRDIDDCNRKTPGSAKVEILPSQSDIKSRKEMAALEKELCRQKKRGEGTTIPKYAAGLKNKKRELQEKQIRNGISNSFQYFLHCLFYLDPLDRKYFLQCLKLGLDERSIQLLQPLYVEYEKCRTEEESPERDARLKSLDEQLTHGSLGIEHFFREMAVMYENIVTIKSAANCNGLDEILEVLAEIMAAVLMDGTAIEIMDGDVVNVPVNWLTAVLKKIDQTNAFKLYKVAVLGAQSCGKSTLLNTTFGLNFPVSSGRCTRGAYMQLVKVDGELKETLYCDYVAVIDSEGLMSRTKADDSDYDNELSTFIIGLSDLTLVIIKGEGTEMRDVLPLAIHVFLRMNIVGEHQACHFVHQNMGAVDVMTKIATEIDAFVRDLNTKTEAAAKDVGQSDQYKKFTDVLKYDATKDNTYVPGLWDGTLPMAKTNAHYSRIMERLRFYILSNAVDMHNKYKKQLFSSGDFAKRLDELWEAIKYENFILSFRNVLAVEAHRKLSEVYKELQMEIKRKIRQTLKGEINKIENETADGDFRGSIPKLVEDSRHKITENIILQVADMSKQVMHYFQCPGCKDCNCNVSNRHLLGNNEKEFEDEMIHFQRLLTREVDKAMEVLEHKLKTNIGIRKLSNEMNDILKQKVQEAIFSAKETNTTDIEETFDNMWAEATGDIMRMMRNVKQDEEGELIEPSVQSTIRSLLDRDSHLYIRKQSEEKQGNKRRPLPKAFVVDPKKHIALKGLKNKLKGLFYRIDDQDVRRMQSTSDIICRETSKYYRSVSSEGKQFTQSDAEQLFSDVLERIKAIQEQKIQATEEYKIDLLYHIETLAVDGFTEMHKKYLKESSREAFLEEKKKSYHDLFIIQMGQGDAAAKFSETVLQGLILKNVDENLSCTELLHDLRVHCGELFRDIKSIQAAIMVGLYSQNSFQDYKIYICNYERQIKQKMKVESITHFSKKNRLQTIACIKLDQIISNIQKAVEETVNNPAHGTKFVKQLFSKIDYLKIGHNEAAAYLELDVPDRKQFGDIVRQHLDGKVKENLVQTIRAWNVKQKLEEKGMHGLTEFLFTEIIGCNATCPFCRVPCDNHSGGKTQGQHSATLHRPQGLGGKSWHKTSKLVVEDCPMGIALGTSFRHAEEWVPYKEYQKIYPKWTIHGNTNPETEKYWKWVFAKFNAELAEYYSAEESDDIPEEWSEYTTKEIKRDLEDNYHIKVDISSLEIELEDQFNLRYLFG